MIKTNTKIVLMACAATLGACSFEGGQNGVSPLLVEAGKVSSTFGNTTANNIAVMNGELQQEMVKNLTRLFAAEAPATINLEFNSRRYFRSVPLRSGSNINPSATPLSNFKGLNGNSRSSRGLGRTPNKVAKFTFA